MEKLIKTDWLCTVHNIIGTGLLQHTNQYVQIIETHGLVVFSSVNAHLSLMLAQRMVSQTVTVSKIIKKAKETPCRPS